MNRNQANYIFPLITQVTDSGIRFCLETDLEVCGIVLYDLATGNEIKRIAFEQSDRVGNLYCKTVEGYDPKKISYAFYIVNHIVTDARATRLVPGRSYGMAVKEPLKAVIYNEDYDWEGDTCPRLKYENSFWYLLHVRGFTKSPSSGVKAKGTFAGIIEKLDHLQSIGVTTIELQPAYEFIEWDGRPELEPEVGFLRTADPSGEKDLYTANAESIRDASKTAASHVSDRLNYWGYKPGYYYAPKENYSYSKDPVREFRDLVKELHKRGMELCMQFYFVPDYPESEILEILRYWVVNFHVDAFHLMGLNIPMRLVSTDSLLARTKILSDHLENVNFNAVNDEDRFIGFYTDDFQYPLKRLLKSDEGMVSDCLSMLRLNPEKHGRINFLSSYRGFTLMDLVSYNRKHNEENGEDGRDGSDFNFSWNCGEEGPTRKKKIRDLRIRQIKNAYSLLMLGAGTPLIFMGDEFGNSQKGNNNPYCIDSSVTWLDWKDITRNEELIPFLTELVRLRREHTVFSKKRELFMIDTENCGYPEISYHSNTAWRVSSEYYSRSFGVMYCEKKAEKLLYAAVNMGWEETVLALPRPPKGYEWKLILSTDPEMNLEAGNVYLPVELPEEGSVSKAGSEGTDKSVTRDELERPVPGRTVAFYETAPIPEKNEKKTGRVYR